MAEAVLEVVYEKLKSHMKEKGLFIGSHRDSQSLESKLSEIMAVVYDAEQKQFEDRSIKDLLPMLKDASYELDDVLDECAYEAWRLKLQGASDKVQCSCLSSFHPKHVAFRYKIAKKMRRITERFGEIYEEMRYKFSFTEIRPRISFGTEWRVPTTSILVESRVYGREVDTENIVDFLVAVASRYENLSVYPIVGLGGLGKTTLAKVIFNHERVVKHFDLRSWICVSNDFSLMTMTKDVIEAASGSVCKDLDLESLQRKLQELLQRRRYLLVLDDVWDDEQENWQRFKSMLACGAKGASILVTTRLSKVAAFMGTVPPHELSMLSDNDCWQLFKDHAFRPNEKEQFELVAIGKEIVKKCGRVPLAAKVLGGLLRFNREEKEWLNVKESTSWSLPRDENYIMHALTLSYLNLPIKLRQCLAYCAIFPKDEIIRKQDLIEIWMANGFISFNEELDVEDAGDVVWNELYGRSFFKDIETDEFGKITSFKMHNIVHDFAQFIAEDVCCITNDNGVTMSERIHHISDHSRGSKLDSVQLHQFKSLRTYILPPQRYNTGQLSPHVLKYYSLRVLRYEPREELPSSIGRLKHLRYLNISGGDFITLPDSLCKLWNLQILKLDYCHRLQKLPNNLICLKALQMLSLNGCNSLSSLPPQIGKLTSLRNISMYLIGKEKGLLLAELGPLKLKGDLHIKHLGRVKSVMDCEKANMSSKKLNKLVLSWDENEESELEEHVEEIVEVLQPNTQQLESLSLVGYKGDRFPPWISSPSLKYLELEDCISCLQLPALGKLASLKTLRIYNMIHVEHLNEESYDGGVIFMGLENLSLEKLPNLVRISREDGENMFPHLSKFEIFECPKLLGLPNFPSIKDLHIQGNCKLDLLSSIHKLSSLEYLWIEDNEELKCFPNGMLQNLNSLKELYFHRLFKIEVLPTKLLLHSLKKLEIVGSRKFNDSKGLHEALQHVTALQELKLEHLPNLQLLPNCFGDLSLLRLLTLHNCSKLACLPSSLRFSCLDRLDVQGCPELEKRCREDTGEDWGKIAHIPNIRVIPMRP